MINIKNFIHTKVIKRKNSLFKKDLLNFNSVLKKRIENKSFLVIGGAGTIGSSYIKALLRFKISKLIVIDINENGLTELVRDTRSSNDLIIPQNFITYPVDFGDQVFEKIFNHHGPFDVVANFAAHKHVRSEKDGFSIEAMINNNVIKAKKLLDLLVKNPPEHFFCVSTDKAANPVNIMGATKKLMEELIISYSTRLNIKTARFANVAFSNGSLLKGFMDRLMLKQPWSCPLGIKRFFVSPEESGELCLIACMIGESGDIFYPKLSETKDMIPFDDIALDFLEYLNLKPKIFKTEQKAKDFSMTLDESSQFYPIYFFESETSGEKSFEEFYTENEILDTNSFEKLGVIKKSSTKKVGEFDNKIKSIENLFKQNSTSKNKIVETLKKFLPNFNHIETGKSLDQKM